MDSQRFDDLAKILAGGSSRRVLLRLVGGSTIGGLLGVRRIAQAAGACQTAGAICTIDEECCSAACRGGVCLEAVTPESVEPAEPTEPVDTDPIAEEAIPVVESTSQPTADETGSDLSPEPTPTETAAPTPVGTAEAEGFYSTEQVAGADVVQVAAGEFSVPATAPGWHQTPLSLQQEEQFIVAYVSGTWTVDANLFPFVGPDGYPPEIDSQIFQGCKLDSSLPYATLLGMVEDGPFFAIGQGGTFTANATGTLFLKINDLDACLADNSGAVVVGLNAIDCQDDLQECGGVCVDITRDPDNCSGCAIVCPEVPNATRACEPAPISGAACVYTCQSGFEDCDGDILRNGCETDLREDRNNCDQCGIRCTSGPGQLAFCDERQCRVECLSDAHKPCGNGCVPIASCCAHADCSALSDSCNDGVCFSLPPFDVAPICIAQPKPDRTVCGSGGKTCFRGTCAVQRRALPDFSPDPTSQPSAYLRAGDVDTELIHQLKQALGCASAIVGALPQARVISVLLSVASVEGPSDAVGIILSFIPNATNKVVTGIIDCAETVVTTAKQTYALVQCLNDETCTKFLLQRIGVPPARPPRRR